MTVMSSYSCMRRGLTAPLSIVAGSSQPLTELTSITFKPLISHLWSLQASVYEAMQTNFSFSILTMFSLRFFHCIYVSTLSMSSDTLEESFESYYRWL